MIPHLHIGLQGVAAFIHVGQHVHVGARIGLVGVPLVVGDHEGARHILHHGMLAVLHLHRAVRLVGDVVLVAYLTHEVREPFPHRIAVKLAQQRSVVEADEPSPAAVDIFLHVALCSLAPCVGRMVELQHQPILPDLTLRNLLSRLQHGQLQVQPFLLFVEPLQASGGESLVQTSALSQHQHTTRLYAVHRFLIHSEAGQAACSQQHDDAQVATISHRLVLFKINNVLQVSWAKIAIICVLSK